MSLRTFLGAILLSATHYVTPVFSQEMTRDIITDKGKITLELGASYLTGSKTAGITHNTLMFHMNTKVYRIGGRYGLSEDSEVYAQAIVQDATNILMDRRTGLVLNRSSPTYAPIFSAIMLGGNHRIKGDNNFGIIGFSDIFIPMDHRLERFKYWREDNSTSLSTGFRIYGTSDKVTLSSDLGYKAKFAYTTGYATGDNHISYDNSDVLFFEPRIAFEFNEKTTIMGGVPIHMVGHATRGGVSYRPQVTHSFFEFGVTRELDNRTNLSFQAVIAEAQQPFQSSIDMHLTLTKQLDGFFN